MFSDMCPLERETESKGESGEGLEKGGGWGWAETWDEGEEGRAAEGSRVAVAQVLSITGGKGWAGLEPPLLPDPPSGPSIPSPLPTLSVTLLTICPQCLLL